MWSTNRATSFPASTAARSLVKATAVCSCGSRMSKSQQVPWETLTRDALQLGVDLDLEPPVVLRAGDQGPARHQACAPQDLLPAPGWLGAPTCARARSASTAAAARCRRAHGSRPARRPGRRGRGGLFGRRSGRDGCEDGRRCEGRRCEGRDQGLHCRLLPARAPSSRPPVFVMRGLRTPPRRGPELGVSSRPDRAPAAPSCWLWVGTAVAWGLLWYAREGAPGAPKRPRCLPTDLVFGVWAGRRLAARPSG